MPLGAARFGLGGVDLGKLELIETQSHSTDVNSIIFDDLGTDYDVHFITCMNMGCNGNPQANYLQFYESGVVETGTVYQYGRQVIGVNAANVQQKDTDKAYLPAMGSFSNATNDKQNAYIYLYNALDNTKYTYYTIHDIGVDYYSGGLSNFASGALPQLSVVDGFRLHSTPLGWNSYEVSLYGIKG